MTSLPKHVPDLTIQIQKTPTEHAEVEEKMVSTTERNTSTYTYATLTYSGSIADEPVFSWPSSILRCESQSTTTTLGFLTRDPIGFEGSEWNLFASYLGLKRRDPTGLGCNLCFKPGRLVQTIYEPDDPNEIAACIYEYAADPQNPRHNQTTAGGMTADQQCRKCKPVPDCNALQPLDLSTLKIKRALAPVGGGFPYLSRPRCPAPPEIEDSCLAITGKECPDFFQSLDSCLQACGQIDRIEKICSKMPSKPLKELCKISLEQGEELCKEFCRLRSVEVIK